MQSRHVLRALALAFLVAAPVLAQSTRRIVVNGAPSAAPASGGAAAPAPAAPAPSFAPLKLVPITGTKPAPAAPAPDKK
mgnify:CR=1 FL=1